jgi:hypothetical protein
MLTQKGQAHPQPSTVQPHQNPQHHLPTCLERVTCPGLLREDRGVTKDQAKGTQGPAGATSLKISFWQDRPCEARAIRE